MNLKKGVFLHGLICICYLVSLSSVLVSAHGYCAEVATTEAKTSEYAFDPDELDHLRAQATAEADEMFSKISPPTVLMLAKAYFNVPEGGQVAQQDLVLAYKSESVIYRIYDLLKVRYKGRILDKLVWAWNNVGGVYGRIAVVSCSLNEYLAFFGSPLAQTGFSGEYSHMDVYDIMVSGQMYSHGPSSEEAFPLLYEPGKTYSLLKRGETRLYTMSKYSYMIDYGRGVIPSAFWQGIVAPFLFINHDLRSFKDQLKSCGASMVMSFKERFFGSRNAETKRVGEI